MRTITNEVGYGPIEVIEVGAAGSPECLIETGDREVSPPSDGDITVSLDNIRETNKFRYRPDQPLPLASLVATVDNGPVPVAANDNVKPAAEPSDPLSEIYERGELGINEPENRQHLFDANRFRRLHDDARGEPDNSDDNWRELLIEFCEGYFDNTITSLSKDEGLVLNDDMEFDDTDTPADSGAVDCAAWNPYRDSEPHVRKLYGQQVAALMSSVLGADYDVLEAFIVRRWTARQIGETQGYKDRASASACGKGMIRSALRNLSRFYLGLDRLEERGQRPQDVWPLLGTLNWPVKRTPGYYRPRDNMFTNKTAGPVRQYRDAARIAA